VDDRMIEVIVGNNASGKTLYLKSNVKKCNSNSCLTNFGSKFDAEAFEYDTELVEVLDMNCDAFSVYVKGNVLVFDDYVYSDKLLNTLHVILRKVDFLFLDEPELGLKDYEVAAVSTVLQNIRCRECIVTTHSDIIAASFMDDLYIINDNKLEKVNYEDTDCI
jgi:hypothetical protein